jgi:uncharacterized membrane protein YkoI
MKKLIIIVGLMLVTLTSCGTQGDGSRVIIRDTRANTVQTASAATVVPEGSLSQSGTPSGGTNAETYITEEQAKEIAFTHASVTQDNVSLLRVQFDYDDWRAVYEVDFYSDYNEYDYDIDATTGEILGYDVDMEHNVGAIPQTGNTSTGNTPTGNTQTNTQSQTTSAASQNTQSDTQSQTTQSAQNTQAVNQPTQSDAPASQNTQATAPVSQVTQSASPSPQNTQATAPANTQDSAPAAAPAPGNSTSNDSWISSTDAENAALSHAGVTSSDVSYLRSHLDRDDGKTMYEVSFYYNYMEYEYDVDALTGNILSFDQDYD